MDIHHHKVIVIDDNEDEGKQIVDALWAAHIPVHFFHYDDPKVVEASANNLKHIGIRAVLLDINLTDGPVGKSDYLAAAKAIELLISENNGPWVLITWTSYQDKTDELLEFFNTRLQQNLRPIGTKSLNKEDYQSQDSQLDKQILKLFSEYTVFKFLKHWELAVNHCAAEAIFEVSNLAYENDLEKFESRLFWLLESLSIAERGRHDTPDDKVQALHTILSNILKDRLTQFEPQLDWPDHPSLPPEDDEEKIWRSRINTMLHLEMGDKGKSTGTGKIYQLPLASGMERDDNGDERLNISNATGSIALPIRISSDQEYAKFIRKYFLTFKRDERGIKQEVTSSGELVLVDVTPPCDHAQKKVFWRKFIVGLKLPCSYEKHLWLIKRTSNEAGEKIEERIDGQLGGDYLWVTPNFFDGEKDQSFLIVVNSKLTLSIDDEIDVIQQLGYNLSGRIREQLMQSLFDWLRNQITRSGFTCL